MATVDDRDLSLGRLYARAMLELASEKGEEDALGEELRELVRAVGENAELADFLATPLIDDDHRAATLERNFRGKASDLLVDSLQVLRRKGRLGKLAAIAGAWSTRRSRRPSPCRPRCASS